MLHDMFEYSCTIFALHSGVSNRKAGYHLSPELNLQIIGTSSIVFGRARKTTCKGFMGFKVLAAFSRLGVP